MTKHGGEPEWLRTSGWQRVDDEHPPGTGRPAYRVVYKTLRYIVPFAEFAWPNLRINTGRGSVDRGGMLLPGALPTRYRHRWLLPESGTLVEEGGLVRYEPRINMQFNFQAWQKSLDDVFYVEFILETTEEEPDDRLAEGTRRLGPLLTLFDLRFGPRVLGLRLAEELGEVFDDGNFNRELVSERVGAESQYDVAGVEAADFLAWAKRDFDRLMQKTASELERIRLACDWYWTAIHAPNPVDEYLGLWFVVEVLAMPNTANVRPVRELLARERCERHQHRPTCADRAEAVVASTATTFSVDRQISIGASSSADACVVGAIGRHAPKRAQGRCRAISHDCRATAVSETSAVLPHADSGRDADASCDADGGEPDESPATRHGLRGPHRNDASVSLRLSR